MNVIILACAVPLSYFGGYEIGLSGAAAGSVAALFLDRTLVLHRIAAITGVPVAKQQHWEELGRHFAWTAAAAASAWLVVHFLFAGAHHAVRLAAGAAVLGVVYGITNLRGKL
jgi:hypothetical protein